VDLLHERRDARSRLAADGCRARRLPQARSRTAGSVLQRLQRSGAHPAWREIDHPQERAVIVGRGEQTQIGERVLDFRALEKAHPAVDAIRHAGVEKRVLEHA